MTTYVEIKWYHISSQNELATVNLQLLAFHVKRLVFERVTSTSHVNVDRDLPTKETFFGHSEIDQQTHTKDTYLVIRTS